jgi:hypothetical protein
MQELRSSAKYTMDHLNNASFGAELQYPRYMKLVFTVLNLTDDMITAAVYLNPWYK